MALKTEWKVEVHLEGLAAWGQAVEAAVEAAVDDEGQETLADARERAPVKTGLMRDTTNWQMDTPLSGTLEAPQDYSGLVDQGTSKQAAQPWFTPAVEQAEARFPNRLAEAIRKAGGEVAG